MEDEVHGRQCESTSYPHSDGEITDVRFPEHDDKMFSELSKHNPVELRTVEDVSSFHVSWCLSAL